MVSVRNQPFQSLKLNGQNRERADFRSLDVFRSRQLSVIVLDRFLAFGQRFAGHQIRKIKKLWTLSESARRHR